MDARDKTNCHFPTCHPANGTARGNVEETEQTIRTGSWQPAQRGKWHARRAFPFDAVSPVNGRHYAYKTVDAVFADNPASIVVVTVKVYYHD